MDPTLIAGAVQAAEGVIEKQLDIAQDVINGYLYERQQRKADRGSINYFGAAEKQNKMILFGLGGLIGLLLFAIIIKNS